MKVYFAITYKENKDSPTLDNRYGENICLISFFIEYCQYNRIRLSGISNY